MIFPRFFLAFTAVFPAVVFACAYGLWFPYNFLFGGLGSVLLALLADRILTRSANPVSRVLGDRDMRPFGLAFALYGGLLLYTALAQLWAENNLPLAARNLQRIGVTYLMLAGILILAVTSRQRLSAKALAEAFIFGFWLSVIIFYFEIESHGLFQKWLQYGSLEAALMPQLEPGLADPRAHGVMEHGMVLLALMLPAFFEICRRLENHQYLCLSAGLIPVFWLVYGASQNLTAQLAIPLAALVYYGTPYLKLSSRRLTRGLSLIVLLALGCSVAIPLSLPHDQRIEWLPNSHHQRLTHWQFSLERIAEKPLFGWGYDSGVSLPGRDAHPFPGAHWHMLQVLPTNPHNAFLEITLLTGITGLALLGAVMAFAIAGIGRMPGDSARYGAAVFITILWILGVWNGFYFHWPQQFYALALVFSLLPVLLLRNNSQP